LDVAAGVWVAGLLASAVGEGLLIEAEGDENIGDVTGKDLDGVNVDARGDGVDVVEAEQAVTTIAKARTKPKTSLYPTGCLKLNLIAPPLNPHQSLYHNSRSCEKIYMILPWLARKNKGAVNAISHYLT
jgi:hypothetical protein